MDWTEEQTFENAKTQFDATKSQCKKDQRGPKCTREKFRDQTAKFGPKYKSIRMRGPAGPKYVRLPAEATEDKPILPYICMVYLQGKYFFSLFVSSSFGMISFITFKT